MSFRKKNFIRAARYNFRTFFSYAEYSAAVILSLATVATKPHIIRHKFDAQQEPSANVARFAMGSSGFSDDDVAGAMKL